MESMFERRGEMLGTLTIKVWPEDYTQEAQKKLKKLAKTISLKGFRQGKAPLPLVDKMVGVGFKEEAISEIINKELSKLFSDPEINILFQPIPTGDSLTTDKLESNSGFEFQFDFFITPKLDCKDGVEKLVVTDYEVLVGETEISAHKKYFVDKHRKYQDTEEIFEGSYFKADISNGNTMRSRWISMERDIKPECYHLFLGKKINDQLEVSLKDALVEENIPLILGEDYNEFMGMLQVTITAIQKSYALSGKELYQESFPGAEIEDEETFEQFVAQDLKNIYLAKNHQLRIQSFKKKLIELYSYEIDDDLLSRFLSYSVKDDDQNKFDLSSEKLVVYKQEIIISSIAESLIRNFRIDVTNDELIDYELGKLLNQFGGMIDPKVLRPYISKRLEENPAQLNKLKTDYALEIFPNLVGLQIQMLQVSAQDFDNLYREHFKN
jgi:trigger factor